VRRLHLTPLLGSMIFSSFVSKIALLSCICSFLLITGIHWQPDSIDRLCFFWKCQ